MAEQISATVLKIGTTALFLVPQDWSFPTKAIAMEETVSGSIKTRILYEGVSYYVSETLDELLAQAGASPKVYTALLSQSGTDDPVATIVGTNTVGSIVWSRQSAGNYVASLEGGFNSKTIAFPVSTENFRMHTVEVGGSDEILFHFSDISEASADTSFLVTIEVYP